MKQLGCLVKKYSKAIASFVGAAASFWMAKKAVHLPFLDEAGIVAFVTAVIVGFSPKNAEC